jgi:hypothetical protein
MNDQLGHSHADPRNPTLGSYLELLKYHHLAMESRRGIELKIFTGAVTLILVATKGLYDARIATMSGAPSLCLGAFGLLLAIYGFMLWRIEIATSFDRRMYHAIENRIRDMLSIKTILEPESRWTTVWHSWTGWRPFRKKRSVANAAAPEKSGKPGLSPKRESLSVTLLRSWAAVPPFLAACVITAACWVFLFLPAIANNCD